MNGCDGVLAPDESGGRRFLASALPDLTQVVSQPGSSDCSARDHGPYSNKESEVRGLGGEVSSAASAIVNMNRPAGFWRIMMRAVRD